MDKLIEQFSLGLFFWQTVLFIGLVFLLKKFAWKPILDAVNEREEGIKDALEAAERAREEMVALQANNDKILREARVEREGILNEAREMRDKIIAEAKEKAHEAGAKELEAARQTIHQEKMAAQTELKNELASLSIGIAEKVLKGELQDKSKQESLVASLVEDIKLN
ncbi:ATP synthase subunit [Flavobacteriaceae bacterium UJ101]|nr:ATP synthase subunit [Flavobacteriaceae bacterium UJ101]